MVPAPAHSISTIVPTDPTEKRTHEETTITYQTPVGSAVPPPPWDERHTPYWQGRTSDTSAQHPTSIRPASQSSRPSDSENSAQSDTRSRHDHRSKRTDKRDDDQRHSRRRQPSERSDQSDYSESTRDPQLSPAPSMSPTNSVTGTESPPRTKDKNDLSTEERGTVKFQSTLRATAPPWRPTYQHDMTIYDDDANVQVHDFRSNAIPPRETNRANVAFVTTSPKNDSLVNSLTLQCDKLSGARTLNEYTRWLERSFVSKQAFVTSIWIDDVPALALIDSAIDISAVTGRFATSFGAHGTINPSTTMKQVQCFPGQYLTLTKRFKTQVTWAMKTYDHDFWIVTNDDLPFDVCIGTDLLRLGNFHSLKRRHLMEGPDAFTPLTGFSQFQREREMFAYLGHENCRTTSVSCRGL